MRPHPLLVVALVGALLGAVFAGFSTYDYVQHLDRQVHDVHCSFVPGLSEDEGETGCDVTMKSSYSSVFRSSIWGGIPISLPALSVFAFLLFFGVDLLFARRQEETRATGFYLLGAALPALASLVMGYISLSVLHAACKLCIGIYVASAMVFVGAGGLWLRARSGGSIGGSGVGRGSPGPGDDPAWASDVEEAGHSPEPAGGGEFGGPGGSRNEGAISYQKLLGFFGLGVLFVAAPVLAYVGTAPDHSQFIGSCGQLEEPPPEKLLVEMGPQQGAPALEVFDPLCPACRQFEKHFERTSFPEKLARKSVLFPLDDECNWMLDKAVHPGACAVSEAILCAKNGGSVDEVVDWAFDNQERIRSIAKSEGRSVRSLIKDRFPGIGSCVGSPKAKAQLNQSLRWTVDNELQILTPQLFVGGVRLCNEDLDLGLEYALSEMLKMRKNGTLKSRVGGESAEEESQTEEGL